MSKTLLNSLPLKCLVLLLSLSVFLGCEEPVEGCFDANAKNYDLDAEDPCADCCVYPSLRVDFEQKILRNDSLENVALSNGRYLDGAGNTFSFESIQFYLSDIHLISTTGASVNIDETVEFEADGQLITTSDNIVLVNPAVFGEKNIGTVNAPGSYKGIELLLGVSSELNQADTLDFEDDHPLSPQIPNMYLGQDTGYIFNTLDLVIEPDLDSIPLNITIATQPFEIPLALDKTFELDKGLNINLTLRVDYLKWFEGTDLRQMTNEDIIQKIVSNIPNSFALVNIEFDYR